MVDGSIARLTKQGAEASRPRWSPDGSQIAYEAVDEPFGDHSTGQVFVMAANGSAVRQLTHGERAISRPDWSPDGARVAVTVAQPGEEAGFYEGGDIGLADVATGQVTRLTSAGPSHDTAPSWSPDGKRMTFIRDGRQLRILGPAAYETLPGPVELWVIDVDTGKGTAILKAEAGSELRDPVWSPDGTRIAFAQVWQNRNKGSDIFLVSPEGASLRNLTNHPAHEESPAWSPDGTWLAYMSDRDFQTSIYAQPVDGQGLVRITEHTEQSTIDLSPSWGP
jgi:Tol biopolymer transport system component